MNAAELMTDHPAHETLSEFYDGKLQPAEYESVAAHVAACAECRDVILTRNALEKEMAEMDNVDNVVPMRSNKGWWITAASVAAAAVLVFGVLFTPVGDEMLAPWRMRQLSAATAELEKRPIEGRPAADIAWHRYENLRGPGDSDVLPLLVPAFRIQQAAKKRPSATNLHHAGVSHLLLQEYDLAVQFLEQALQKETGQTDIVKAIAASKDAALLNDLAAAYYPHGDEKGIAAINRAWEMKKTAPIAWNRALLLNTRQAWDDYFAIDSTSEWAKEAREKYVD